MLDQKEFGNKLRNHRKNLGMTQEEAAERIGISPQAVSKWEAGDCLPDCFNLKAIADVYGISLDILLETEKCSDIEAVADKIEQLGTEFVWSQTDRYSQGIGPLFDDILRMWRGLYFIEAGNRERQAESKQFGNMRVCRPNGLKVWDDDGVVCAVRSELVKSCEIPDEYTLTVLRELCCEDGIKLIKTLDCHKVTPKNEIIEQTGIDIHRLNELLLLFSESSVIEFINDSRMSDKIGYKISGHCGIAAYMTAAAAKLLGKTKYSVNEAYPCR